MPGRFLHNMVLIGKKVIIAVRIDEEKNKMRKYRNNAAIVVKFHSHIGETIPYLVYLFTCLFAFTLEKYFKMKRKSFAFVEE